MEEKASFGATTREFISHNLLFVGLISIGLILLLVGLYQYLNAKNIQPDIQFVSADDDVKGTTGTKIKVSVDVEGSVQKPGVYALAEGSRLQDALIAAGGLSSKADRDYVSKRLNQAQKIVDGAKIYIPSKGEFEAEQVSGSNTVIQSFATDLPINNSTLININTASMEGLDSLPKVGPVTAQKIVNGRPYGSIEDLVSKKILTQKTFDGLKDGIVAQ